MAALPSGQPFAAGEPLAIVGAACRLPGSVNTPAQLWELLCGGVDAVGELPPLRWPDAQPPGSNRWGAFLDDVAGFDASFFRITPREASRVDPQQRLLLELAWHALEDACIPAAELAGSNTAVDIGISSHDYFELATAAPEQIDQYTGSGTSVSIAAGRVAFSLGFEGPALAVDTACSSSLVAVHLAAMQLAAKECDLALAGGMNLMLTPTLRLIEARLGAQSPSGRCRSFDAAADGIVSGEGAGLIVLERLSDALANGHRIRALVLGSAINHDGRSSGLTVPNRSAQEAVLRSALTRAGIGAERIGYVEAHGSGTPLGDPIEAEALGTVYGTGRCGAEPLPIGSIKTNFGHLGAAAGIAGLLKAMLVTEHGRIPRQLHCSEPNPAVDWTAAGLRIATDELPLRASDAAPAVAGSSFGFSGTNAHVILAAGPSAAVEDPAAATGHQKPCVVTLSAGSEPALHAHAGQMRRHLRAHPLPLASVAKTANLGRSHLANRAAFVVRTPEELDAALLRFEEEAAGAPPSRADRVPATRAPRVAFLFPGQGNQYGEMAGELLETDSVFAAAIARCDRHLSGSLPRSLQELLGAGGDDPDLQRTSIVQPLLVGLGYALAESWKALGVRPAWVVGHSLGELTAACVAGMLSLPDALALAVARGRLMEELPQDGAMALVSCEPSVLEEALARHRPGVSIAAFNGPRQWALSGPAGPVQECAAELSRAGASVKPLAITIAGHSSLVRPITAALKAAAGALSPSRRECRFVSTLTGQIEDEAPSRPEYWSQEAVSPVRFREAIDALVQDGCGIMLELGPGASLVSMVAAWIPDRLLLRSLERGEPAEQRRLATVTELYRRGVAIDWRADALRREGSFVALPGYPFERSRHWLPASEPRSARARSGPAPARPGGHPLLGAERGTVLARRGQTLFEQQLSASAPAYLADHRVGEQLVLPAAAFIEMMLAAARRRWGTERLRLTDVSFDRPLSLGDEPVTVQTVLEEVDPDTLRARIFSPAREPGGWWAHCEAVVGRARAGDHDRNPPAWPDAAAGSADQSAAALRAHYARAAAGGLSLGPSFLALTELAPHADGGTVHVRLPDEAGGAEGYCLHPVLLDAALQGASPALGVPDAGRAYLPTRIEALTLDAAAGAELTGLVSRRPADHRANGSGEVVIDAWLRRPDGSPLALVQGVHMRSVPLTALAGGGRGPAPALYASAWRPAAAPDGGDFAPRATEILILAGGDDGVAESLARLLRRRGCTVSTGRDGGARPAAVILLGGRGADGSTHLAGDVSTDLAADARADVAGDATHIARRALATLRSLTDDPGPEPPAVWLLTEGARRVLPDEPLDGVAQAPLWGLGHVLSREHPELRCTVVDLDPCALEQSLAAVALELVRTLRPGDGDGEDRLAYRGRRRFVERIERLAPSAPGSARLELDRAGTYVITGGLSGLGLATAEWLAERGAGHLALIARSHPTPEAARRIEALRSAGTDVVAHCGDVADAVRLQLILRAVRSRGSLRGVVHAAGVVRDGVISRQPWSDFASVLRPKVTGGWLLHQLTLEDPLQLFVLYSSAVVLLGPGGQAAHTAANAFLGALAHHRRAQARPGLAVDWGAWDGIGAPSVDGAADRMAAAGMGLIDGAAGFQTLETLLLADFTQAAVVPIDWARFTARFGRTPLYRELASDDEAPPAPGQSALEADLRALPEGRRREALAAQLGDAIAKGMQLPGARAINRSARLGELGVDSLLAVELRNRLSTLLGRPLRSTLLFDFPTIDELTDFLGAEVLALWPGENEPADRPATHVEPPDLEGLSADALDQLIDGELLAWQARRQW